MEQNSLESRLGSYSYVSSLSIIITKCLGMGDSKRRKGRKEGSEERRKEGQKEGKGKGRNRKEKKKLYLGHNFGSQSNGMMLVQVRASCGQDIMENGLLVGACERRKVQGCQKVRE